MVFFLPDCFFYKCDHLYIRGWWTQSLNFGILDAYGYNRQIYDPLKTEKVSVPYLPLFIYINHVRGLIEKNFFPHTEPLSREAWLFLVIPNWIAEFLLSLGCMFILSHFKGKKWGFIAFLLMWLCPGTILIGTLNGQVDSWFLAPLVWALYFSMKDKWIYSGVLWGCAFMIKPQASVFIPALLCFLFIRKNFRGLIIFILSSGIISLLLCLPFLLHSGLCFYHCCMANIRQVNAISGYATNIWLFDTALTHNIALNTRVFGITRFIWGIIFTSAALLISFSICIYRYKKSRLLLPVLAALTFTLIFLFSTKIQYRYIIYLLPFLIISACLENRFWIPFAGFTIVSIFECTNHIWFAESLNLYGVTPWKTVLLVVLSAVSMVSFFWWIMEIWKRSHFSLQQSPE